MKYYYIMAANPIPRECGVSRILVNEHGDDLAFNNVYPFYEMVYNITDIIDAYENHNMNNLSYEYENYTTGEKSGGTVYIEEVPIEDLEECIEFIDKH